MSLARKGARSITVDGVTYRWTLRRRPTYDHGMNCCEYIEINFGGAQPTLEQIRRHAVARKASELRHAQKDIDPYDLRMKRPGPRRGGY